MSDRAEVRLAQPSDKEGSSNPITAGKPAQAGVSTGVPLWRPSTSSSAPQPPQPGPSAPPMPAAFTDSHTMHVRIEEELGSLVRAVVGSSRLKTEPTRLELQLVCQELVSQVKSYFAQLEDRMPPSSSTKQPGAARPSAETLSMRMAALGAKSSFSSPQQSSQEVGDTLSCPAGL